MKNITNKKLITQFPLLVNRGRDEPLNDSELQALKSAFYMYAEKYGYYKSISVCLSRKYQKLPFKYLFQPQQELVDALLEAIFQKKQYRIYLSLPRQIGKTEIVTMVASFCYDVFFDVFKKPFLMGVVTPNTQTSSTIFSRLCARLYNMKVPLDVDKNTLKQTVRGDRIELFSIFSDKRSATTEGRTFHLIVRDEAHEGDDDKFEDELIPSLNSTNGSFVLIGNGCTKSCMFWDGIMLGDKEIVTASIKLNDGTEYKKLAYNRVIRYPYTEKIKPYFERLGQEGLTHFLDIIASIELERQRTPEAGDRYQFRKNYECEFVEDQRGFVTTKDLAHCIQNDKYELGNKEVFLGIDVAIKNDRTIAVAISEDGYILDIVILKDAKVDMSATEQMEAFVASLKWKPYFKNIVGAGLDFTGGYGDASRTVLERSSLGFPIYDYHFSRKKKHTIYANLKQCLTTINPEDRIMINPKSFGVDILIKELVELQVKYDKNGYGEYYAPRKANSYDDVVCALAIANDIRGNFYSLYTRQSEDKEPFEYFLSFSSPS